MMSNAKFISRHPLGEAAVHGIEMPGVNHLELVDGSRIHSVLAFRGREAEVADRLKDFAPGCARTVGPGEWLLVNADPAGTIEPAVAMAVDQSHGRCLFRLTGPDATALLMKGVAVDLAGDALPVGSSANMAFGHLTINLARIADNTFEIIGTRSFAESLFHDLKLAGREFALSFAIREA